MNYAPHPLFHPAISVALLLLAGTFALLFGCNEAAVTSPDLLQQDDQAFEVFASKAAHNTSNVYTFADMSIVGSSRLARHGNSLSMRLQTSEIPPGMAITVWWVVFNYPDNCATAPCGEADLFDPTVMSDVLYAAGHVTGKGNHFNVAAQLKEGDASGSIMPFFNALLGLNLPSVGLVDQSAAEVHLVVRTHQQALPAYMPDMIQTFNGGCVYPPGIPTDFGQPGPNTCSDIQFAIHQP